MPKTVKRIVVVPTGDWWPLKRWHWAVQVGTDQDAQRFYVNWLNMAEGFARTPERAEAKARRWLETRALEQQILKAESVRLREQAEKRRAQTKIISVEENV